MSVDAACLLHGALDVRVDADGRARPSRFLPGQLRALASVRAWHPGYYRQLASCTSGIALEFETDASRVTVEAALDEPPRGTRSVIADVRSWGHVPGGPYDGLSAEVDGHRLPLALPDEGGRVSWDLDDPEGAPTVGQQRLPGMGEPHRVRVWLPCLTSCLLGRVRADGTYLESVGARADLLVLGDSLAQGYVAHDPGCNWPALLAARRDLDLVNQGVGGQVFQPGTLRGLSGCVRPESIIVELGENYRYEPCQASRVERDVRGFLAELSGAFPAVPIWVLTTLPHLEDRYPTHPASCFAVVDDLIRSACAAHPQMRLVEGSALLDRGPKDLAELLADGSDHPGPAGQKMVAERLGFVMDATADPPETRRARGLEFAEAAGDVAFPLAECLRRGIAEVLFAQSEALVVEVSDGSRLVWARDRALARRALTCLGRPHAGVTCVCGDAALAREVARTLGSAARPCHLVILAGVPRPSGPRRDVRVLTPSYAGSVRAHYAHAEYLSPGELERVLAGGALLGGFEDGRLVGFVGEHPEGSMGMLEVFGGHRRAGWGTQLLLAQAARAHARGWKAWAEVWPDNAASLALMRAVGGEVRPADQLWFVS